LKVLVVEDEPKVAGALEEGLGREGYAVSVSGTGEDAFFRLSTEAFDLVVLDLMLPGRSGFEILDGLRDRGVETPVLVLTAKDAVADRVRGLDAGADDYLVKPFAFPELTARIRALLRRGRPGDALRLRAADLTLDLVTRRAERAGRRLDLTPRELEILACLLRHAGRPVSREMLAADVWSETARATPLDNVIDVHVARLRRKVDGDHPVPLIHTLRGVGHVLSEEAP